ncbi:MAG: o-succinylbenzoate synthase [Simkaniaceae bacterium]|nr:o-succinylbenzoate synthase [Simkaniaceae bacterium]
MQDLVRKGLLLRLVGEGGNVGWGEIAPLPPCSVESLGEATEQIIALLPLLLTEQRVPETLFPSVSFGVESALADLRRAVPVRPPLVCALITDLLAPPEICAKRIEGYRAAKIKVGCHPLDKEISALSTLLSLLPRETEVLVDANGSWSLEEGCRFAEAFPPSTFSFFEEPLRRFEDYVRFPHPFALDETVRALPGSAYLELPLLRGMVIKPTMTGGPTRLLPSALSAKQRGIRLYLSSSYESALGLSRIAQMAEELSLPDIPMGIGTLDPTEDSLFEEEIEVEGGRWLFPSYYTLKDPVIVVHEER